MFKNKSCSTGPPQKKHRIVSDYALSSKNNNYLQDTVRQYAYTSHIKKDA